MAPSAKLQKFEAVFLNKIVPELVKDAKDNNMPKEAVDWYERVCFVPSNSQSLSCPECREQY